LDNIQRILITGANGQLGSEFQKLFNILGVSCIATDFNELDITQKSAIENFIIDKEFDCIINCAAYNDVDGAEKDKDNCFLLNAYAPHYLADIAKKIGAIFIHYSTDFVFDGCKNSPYTEEDNPNPISIYGQSKLEGENRVLDCYEKSIVIRTSWLFGIAGKNFNTQVLSWAKKQNELKIVDDQVSSPTYAKDLAEFSWLLLQKKVYGLFHFSNDGVASKFDQAKYLLQKAGWKGCVLRGKMNEFLLQAKRPFYSKLDSSKMENIVNKKIPSWQSGIDRWYEEWIALHG